MFGRVIKNCATCPVGEASPERCPLTPVFVPAQAVAASALEQNPNVYFVRNGVVALESGAGSGDGVALRGPGSLVGTEALLGRGTPYSVRALTDAWLCTAPAKDFRSRADAEPALGRALTMLALEEASDAHRDLTTRRGGAVERVARTLLARTSEANTSVHVAKRTIARSLEMRPETFSRSLRVLSDEGLIDGRGGIEILDRERLAERAFGHD